MLAQLLSPSRPTWARGLKHRLTATNHIPIIVAPHVGAWIETWRNRRGLTFPPVAPHVGAWIETPCSLHPRYVGVSRPTWARGLKQSANPDQTNPLVAPHVGAWIETTLIMMVNLIPTVAPHVGAWIETTIWSARSPMARVAPHVGAWIETPRPKGFGRLFCRAPRGRVD